MWIKKRIKVTCISFYFIKIYNETRTQHTHINSAKSHQYNFNLNDIIVSGTETMTSIMIILQMRTYILTQLISSCGRRYSKQYIF